MSAFEPRDAFSRLDADSLRLVCELVAPDGMWYVRCLERMNGEELLAAQATLQRLALVSKRVSTVAMTVAHRHVGAFRPAAPAEPAVIPSIEAMEKLSGDETYAARLAAAVRIVSVLAARDIDARAQEIGKCEAVKQLPSSYFEGDWSWTHEGLLIVLAEESRARLGLSGDFHQAFVPWLESCSDVQRIHLDGTVYFVNQPVVALPPTCTSLGITASALIDVETGDGANTVDLVWSVLKANQRIVRVAISSDADAWAPREPRMPPALFHLEHLLVHDFPLATLPADMTRLVVLSLRVDGTAAAEPFDFLARLPALRDMTVHITGYFAGVRGEIAVVSSLLSPGNRFSRLRVIAGVPGRAFSSLNDLVPRVLGAMIDGLSGPHRPPSLARLEIEAAAVELSGAGAAMAELRGVCDSVGIRLDVQAFVENASASADGLA